MIPIKCRGDNYIIEAEDQRSAICKLVEIGVDLSKIELSGVDLSETNLSCARFKGADLSGAILYGTDFRGANLSEANLKGTDFRGADLRGANLRGANLESSKLNNADLFGADLRGANLHVTDLSGADLRGANLDLSCWSLACKSLQAKIDDKIRIQLLYHATRPIGDIADPDLKALLNSELYKKVVNKFHRKDCEKIV